MYCGAHTQVQRACVQSHISFHTQQFVLSRLSEVGSSIRARPSRRFGMESTTRRSALHPAWQKAWASIDDDFKQALVELDLQEPLAWGNLVHDEDDDDYLIDHSIVLYLVGPDGKFLDFFTQATPADAIAAKIREHRSAS